MIEYSPTGMPFNFLIKADYTPASDWMAFALWYSLQKTWSDCKIFISMPKIRGTDILYRWIDPCKVKKTNFNPPKPYIILPYNCIALNMISPKEWDIITSCAKTYDDNASIYTEALGEQKVDFITQDINSDKRALFYTINKKMGVFDIDKWTENTKIAPFGAMWQTTHDNEKKVMELWTNMFGYHGMVNR